MNLKKKVLKICIKIITLIGSLIIKKENIVLLSNGLKTFDGNTKYLYNFLDNESNLLEFKFFWVTDNKSEYKKMLKNNYKIIYSYSIKGLVTILKSKIYVITISINDIIDGLYVCKDKTVIQTWHGIPIKSLGKKAGKYYSKCEIEKQINRCFNMKYTYVLSSSKYIEELFTECFDVKNEKFLPYGYPRNDIFREKNNLENKKLILGGDHEESKIILYCPTWRENGNFKLLPFDDGNISKFNTFLKENNMIFLLKLHPLHQTESILSNNFSNIKLIKNEFNLDTQELLQVTDILLTDYSSIFFDFILMNKPTLFLPYDYDEYSKTRDFLYPYYDNIPGPIINNYRDLERELLNPDKDIYKFKRKLINDKFNDYSKYDSSKKIKQFILKKMGK